MKEYYFLFALAFLWTTFASIQDLKKREVANWLNFSLIVFALTYRAFYAYFISDYRFFLFGLLGFGFFFFLAHILYYVRAFAGGDAKLLMGFGSILPYGNYNSLIPTALLFLFLLFFIGTIYSLIYSGGILLRNKKKFLKEFKKRVNTSRFVLSVCLFVFGVLLIYSSRNPIVFVFSLFFLIPFVWVYTKSIDVCMVKLLSPNNLTEGDWLVKNVKLSSGGVIKKTVHGLSLEEIKLLKKHRRSVLIKEGIPFVPAFFFSLVILIVWFFRFGDFSLFNLGIW